MKMKLNPALTEKVLALISEYHYSPEELLGVGIALAGVVLEERTRGNRVLVIAPDGGTVAEFKEVEPAAIHQVARDYVQSICSQEDTSATLLVQRLERERDLERPSLQ